MRRINFQIFKFVGFVYFIFIFRNEAKSKKTNSVLTYMKHTRNFREV